MTPMLREHLIISEFAEQVCRRVAYTVIRSLKRFNIGLHSGDDSGLTNAWEEICAQIQGQFSWHWDFYERTIREDVLMAITTLKKHEREAVWLQTPEGKDWDFEDPEWRDIYPVTDEDILDYIITAHIYRIAEDWVRTETLALSAWSPNPEEAYLDPEARKALGNVSPELVWIQVWSQVYRAVEDYPLESRDAAREMDMRGDFQDLLAALGSWSPVFGINHLVYINDINLTGIMELPPPAVLMAVLRIIYLSDRFASLGSSYNSGEST